jgi:hypothetical protein
MDGRMIATGRSSASFSTNFSARAFVKMYVFGLSPISAGVNFKMI